jgi:hypothetical protein
MADARHVQLIVVCESPPPSAHDGQAAEFGLQDKRRALHPGIAQPDGALIFSCEVSVKPNPKTGAPTSAGRSCMLRPAGASYAAYKVRARCRRPAGAAPSRI